MLERLEGYPDMFALADDVAPFLISAGDRKRVSQFNWFWEQAVLEFDQVERRNRG